MNSTNDTPLQIEGGRTSDLKILATRTSIALLLVGSFLFNYRQHKALQHVTTRLERVNGVSRHNYRAAEAHREQNGRLRQVVRFHTMVGAWEVAQAHIEHSTGQQIGNMETDNVGLPIFSSPIQSPELSGVVTVPQDFEQALRQINHLYVAWHNIGEVETIARLTLQEHRNELNQATISYLEGVQSTAARYHQQLREIVQIYRRDVLRNTMIVSHTIVIPSTAAQPSTPQESAMQLPAPEVPQAPHTQRVRRSSTPHHAPSNGIFGGTLTPNE